VIAMPNIEYTDVDARITIDIYGRLRRVVST
jgi:hypothetical protein